MQNIRDLLDKYTEWLMNHGYCDNDVILEEPGAVMLFFSDDTKAKIFEEEVNIALQLKREIRRSAKYE